MDYHISVSDNGKYIIVNVNKLMTIALGRRCGKEATELGARHNINRYLFDLRGAPNIENVLPNYQFAYEDMDNFGFPKNARSAGNENSIKWDYGLRVW
jgi:hypothetical protein